MGKKITSNEVCSVLSEYVGCGVFYLDGSFWVESTFGIHKNYPITKYFDGMLTLIDLELPPRLIVFIGKFYEEENFTEKENVSVLVGETEYKIGDKVVVIQVVSPYGETPETIEKIIVDEFDVTLVLESGRHRKVWQVEFYKEK